MTITDTFLEEMAKAVNGESFTVPTYLAVATTQVTSISTEDTSLSGEIGTRGPLTGSRTDNVTTLSVVRSGTLVIDTTNGDDIRSSGLFDASSNGNFFTGVVHGGITQTTNFDIDFVYQLTTSR